ncbi:PKD domain-containing protein [Hymenobacter pini]|uniref:PKD domain-containing protein n=1 Tax=Hymenobacter pini TaxID=2880879 RepID=UPI001CF22DF9|nr:PKD domain-containing protein [Hymenobacter pini]MCA8832823.1 PKD domain-containing protein [Hymenobacter pini]
MKSHFLAYAFGSLVIGLGLASCGKKPEACFTIEKGIPSSKVNETVELNAGCSTEATSFVWEWGDGSSDTGIKTNHKYNAAGTFTIKLTAKNDDNSASTTKQVVIVQ